MLANDMRIWIAGAAILAGAGTLLLTLVAADVAGAICAHVRLWVSPRAARQARVRAALAAYRGDQARGGRTR